MTLVAVATSMALLIAMQSIADGLVANAGDYIDRSKVDIAIGVSEGHGMENGHKLLTELMKEDEVRYGGIYLTEFLSFRIPATGKQRWGITQGVIPDATGPILHPDDAKRFPKYDHFGFKEGGDPHYDNNFTGPWTYEVLIDNNMAKEFELARGDQIEIARSHSTPYVAFNITGVFDSELTGTGISAEFYFMVMHLSELQTLAGLDIETEDNVTRVVDRIDSVSLSLRKDIRTDKDKVDRYKKELEDRYPFYNIITKDDQLEQMEQHMTVVNMFFIAIGGVSLMIGLLFVTCIMFMSVIERTNEIGMLRAIGISKRTVFLQILAESLLIVFIGALLGIGPGYIGSILAADYISTTVGTSQTLVVFNPLTVAQLFVMVILLGGLMSMAPAWRAMRLDVIKSLKRVG
jgi:ABC-type antimicrobial peptide transport system permease subunit